MNIQNYTVLVRECTSSQPLIGADTSGDRADKSTPFVISHSGPVSYVQVSAYQKLE